MGGAAIGAAICAGATTLTTGAGAGAAAGCKFLRAESSSGWPGFVASCCCCTAKPIGAAGGAVRATTGRSNASAGGLSPGAAAPRTLLSVGVTGAITLTGALATACGVTCTAARATGWDWMNAVVGTAKTAANASPS